MFAENAQQICFQSKMQLMGQQVAQNIVRLDIILEIKMQLV